jgi:hypothetical protein
MVALIFTAFASLTVATAQTRKGATHAQPSIHCQLINGNCVCGSIGYTGRNIPCRPDLQAQPKPAPACPAAGASTPGARLPYAANQVDADARASARRYEAISWDSKTEPQFNSNFPERLTNLKDGDITLSTLSPTGRTDPTAHLDFAFEGYFRALVSHISTSNRDTYQVLALHNPGSTRPVRVRVMALASIDDDREPYRRAELSRDPPVSPAQAMQLQSRPPKASGPGDRIATRMLLAEVERRLFDRRGEQQPFVIEIGPGKSAVLHAPLHPARTALVTQAELYSDGPVQMAAVYSAAARDDAAIADLLKTGRLVDRDPLNRGKVAGGAVLGQVGGVAEYSKFEGTIVNGAPNSPRLYVFNIKQGQPLLPRGDDAAPLVPQKFYHEQHASLRYGALKSHGNYGAQFIVTGNFRADAAGPCVDVRVFIDTPQEPGYPLDKLLSRSLRNTFEVTRDGQKKYFYASQRGDQLNGTKSSLPIIDDLTLEPGTTATATIRTFYAAYNTPPHIFRVESTPRTGGENLPRNSAPIGPGNNLPRNSAPIGPGNNVRLPR